MFDSIVTTSLSKQIAEAIHNAILKGAIGADQRLPTEEELAQSYGVSRQTIREALKRLAAQSIIRSRRGPSGGTFVNNPDEKELGKTLAGLSTFMVTLRRLEMHQMLEARREMEAVCCNLSVDRRTHRDVEALRAALRHQMNPSLSDADFCDADVAFHRLIADASGNPMIGFLMYAVIEALVPVMNMVLVFVRDRSRIIEAHQTMLFGYEQLNSGLMIQGLNSLLEYLGESYAIAVETREKRKLKAGS